MDIFFFTPKERYMKEKSDKVEKVVVSFKIDKKLKDAVLDIAMKEERTISYICTKAIEEYVKKWKL